MREIRNRNELIEFGSFFFALNKLSNVNHLWIDFDISSHQNETGTHNYRTYGCIGILVRKSDQYENCFFFSFFNSFLQTDLYIFPINWSLIKSHFERFCLLVLFFLPLLLVESIMSRVLKTVQWTLNTEQHQICGCMWWSSSIESEMQSFLYNILSVMIVWMCQQQFK